MTTANAETTAEIAAATAPEEHPRLLLTVSVERVPPPKGRSTPAITRHVSTLLVDATLKAMGGPRAALSRVLDRVGGQVVDKAVGTLIPEVAGETAAGSRCALDDRFGLACEGPAGQVVILETSWRDPLAMDLKPVRLGVSAPACGAHVEVLARMFRQGRDSGLVTRTEPIGGIQR